MSLANLPGPNVTILGLGISGLQSALFLHRRGYRVFCSDGGQSDDVRSSVAELKRQGIDAECGAHSTEKILASDWVVLSPGIPPASAIYQALIARGVPVMSEIEVAFHFCPTQRVIAVTGTCGKTTVATLLGQLMQQSAKEGERVLVCGNIGNPWIGELENLSERDTVVLELSSFQLENCYSFRPWVGILLNLSPNHEDWHADQASYYRAKLRLFQAQGGHDFALFRKQDQMNHFPDYEFKAKCILFGNTSDSNPNQEVLQAVSQIAGIPQRVTDDVWNSFQGIEHRLEVFLNHDGVKYINDSKSTTPSSLAWALQKQGSRQVILIAGGHPKSTNFDSLRELVTQKVKKAILIGEARSILREAWADCTELSDQGTFREAVQAACDGARPGDVVLLSPACASFDMFRNYIERGRQFKEFVKESVALKQGKAEKAASS